MAASDPPTRRLFIGLMPDPAVQAALTDHARRWQWPQPSRPTAPERLHLTLHFLGNVQAHHEQALLQALLQVHMEPLELVLRTPHSFGGGIAVLLPEKNPELQELHRRFAPALQHIGQRIPAHWVPHVTLARKAAGALPPQAPPPIRWPVREFALVWSKLTQPTGYHVLARYGG
jgi:2'-5' RNA ligase